MERVTCIFKHNKKVNFFKYISFPNNVKFISKADYCFAPSGNCSCIRDVL